MRKIMITLTTLAAFAAAGAFSKSATGAPPEEQADREKLIGSWVQSGGTSAWIINSAAEGLHVTQMEGWSNVADFQCNTDGQNCVVKVGGHKATVSMYYNGRALVELETKGDEIVKRRFSILPSGNSMKVEVTPMTGRVQTQALEFERGQPPTSKR